MTAPPAGASRRAPVVTVTPNPSLDHTVEVAVLERGEVQRTSQALVEAGGKGVNVARALAKHGHRDHGHPAGRRRRPADDRTADAATGHDRRGADHRRHPDQHRGRRAGRHHHQAERARAPPCPSRRWPRCSRRSTTPWPAARAGWSRPAACRPARPTTSTPRSPRPRWRSGCRSRSTPPARPWPRPSTPARPWSSRTWRNSRRSSAATWSPSATSSTPPRELRARGCKDLLVSLGGHGALLITAEGSWWAGGPPLVPRSTVGAGDCTLSGYLHTVGTPAERLAGAVAWGRAACLLPGSTVPGPEETQACADAVRVVADPDPLQAVKDVAS